MEGLKSCAAGSGRGVRPVPAAEHPGQTAQGAQQRERLAAAPPQRRDPGDPDRAAVAGGDVQHKAGVFAAAKGKFRARFVGGAVVAIVEDGHRDIGGVPGDDTIEAIRKINGVIRVTVYR